MSRNHDRQITIFSPEGKLYQIEYAMKAVTNAGILGVALRGKDTVCMVCQKKVPDKLMDRSYITNMYNITPKIGCMAIGYVPDCKIIVTQARQIAAKFKDKNGYDIPVHVLAMKLGKQGQIFTQHAGVRPLGATMHLAAFDDEKGAQLWRVDPSGHFFGYKALATGPKDQEANNALEKVVKKTEGGGDHLNTIRKAVDVLQVVLSQDLKPQDIEVGMVQGDGNFRLLSAAEVDDHLTAIHEED